MQRKRYISLLGSSFGHVLPFLSMSGLTGKMGVRKLDFYPSDPPKAKSHAERLFHSCSGEEEGLTLF